MIKEIKFSLVVSLKTVKTEQPAVLCLGSQGECWCVVQPVQYSTVQYSTVGHCQVVRGLRGSCDSIEKMLDQIFQRNGVDDPKNIELSENEITE